MRSDEGVTTSQPVEKGETRNRQALQRRKLRRQMAAAAGKKESVSLSLFWRRIVWRLKRIYPPWHHFCGRKACVCGWADGEESSRRRGGSRSLKYGHGEEVRQSSGGVMCETRDRGIKWPQWHTLLFEEQVAGDL